MKSKGFTDGYKTYDTTNGFGNSLKWQQSFEKRLNFKVLSFDDIKINTPKFQTLYYCDNLSDLRKEYYRLMNIYHPDKAGDTEENKIVAQAINETYFKLKSNFK